MEQLPDDVLLEVLRCLTVKDLFACRLVCKALGALALHPDVWRYRSFNADEDDDHDQLWQPVLRLAPCLGALYATLPPPVWGCLLACTMTRCAVQKLSLTVYEGGCLHTAAVIRNQERLGRLRLLKVAIKFHRNTSKDELEDATALLGTVASTSCLEQLEVNFNFQTPPCSASTKAILAQHGAMTTSSLRSFICPWFARSDHGFANFVLGTHAATLEDIDLGLGTKSSAYSSETAPLLAGMRNLRKLRCPLLPGLEALVACESLTVLTVNVCDIPERRALVGAASLLRRAHQLHQVKLYYGSLYEDSSLVDLGVDLIRALASSGRSQLESLTIKMAPGGFGSRDKCSTLVTPLMAALPSLPALRHLAVDPAPMALLLDITPQTTPALQGVELHPLRDERLPCAHAWLHTDAVKKLFSNNFSLKLFVPSVPKYCRKKRECEVCALGCRLPDWKDVQLEEFSFLHGASCITIPPNKFCN